MPSGTEKADLLRHAQVTEAAAAALAEVSRRRSATWWLLSRLVIEQPLAPWLNELELLLAAVNDEDVAGLERECVNLRNALAAARAHTDGLTALAVDRTTLLAGVMQKSALAAPYESVVQGSPMNGELVLDVVTSYREAGLDNFSPELGPPDFLGTELRFMAVLCFNETQAYDAKDFGLARLWLSRQRRFMTDHIMQWVPAHSERLSLSAATAFYKAVFDLLRQACLLDDADIEQMSEGATETSGAATAAESTP